MSSTDKSKTSITKFEEFISTKYKDDVFKVLEKYPDNRSLIIDYIDLEMFDPDLADLLIEKPDDVLLASAKAVKNIDPLMKDADLNIRLENLTNLIQLKHLLSKYIGKFVSVEGIVRKTDEIRPRIETGVFECRGCMRLHEVEQTNTNTIVEPSLCTECGGRSFRLLQEESRYIDTQTARVQEPLENLSGGTEPKQILIILEDDLVDVLNPGDKVIITGTLKHLEKREVVNLKIIFMLILLNHKKKNLKSLKLVKKMKKRLLNFQKIQIFMKR